MHTDLIGAVTWRKGVREVRMRSEKRNLNSDQNFRQLGTPEKVFVEASPEPLVFDDDLGLRRRLHFPSRTDYCGD